MTLNRDDIYSTVRLMTTVEAVYTYLDSLTLVVSDEVVALIAARRLAPFLPLKTGWTIEMLEMCQEMKQAFESNNHEVNAVRMFYENDGPRRIRIAKRIMKEFGTPTRVFNPLLRDWESSLNTAPFHDILLEVIQMGRGSSFPQYGPKAIGQLEELLKHLEAMELITDAVTTTNLEASS